MIKKTISEIISEGYTDGIMCAYGKVNNVCTISTGIIAGTNSCVSSDVLYDLASVTKIITLISILKMQEDNLIDINQTVGYYTDKFQFIKDIKIYELMNFSCKLVTDKRIDECDSRDEALKLIYNVKIIPNSIPQYSDIGAIVLVELVNVIQTSKDFFYRYTRELWKEIGMTSTYWWNDIPKEKLNKTQCYDNEYRVADNKLLCIHTPLGQSHDKKARILCASGHAGVFSTTNDIITFISALLQKEIINDNSISLLTGTTFDSFNGLQHYGLLCYKKADTAKISEVPSISSNETIAISGYTGTYLLIDFLFQRFIFIGSNRIYNRITHSENSGNNVDIPYPYTKDYVYKKDAIVNEIVKVIYHNVY